METSNALDRAPIWLDLLPRLTDASPLWIAWKNVDSALYGTGDIDSMAPRGDWPVLAAEFRAWAHRYGLGPVVLCPHAPNLLHMIAIATSPPFFEVDLSQRKVFLGSTLFEPEDLLPVTLVDERGVRRTRAGAEALIKLVNNGAFRNGLPNHEGIKAKRIIELLAADPEGVAAAAYLFGPARHDIVKLATAVVQGGWDRRAMLSLQGWFLARAVLEPQSVMARLVFRRNKRRCPALRAVFSRHRVTGDIDVWVRDVERFPGHTVYRDP